MWNAVLCLAEVDGVLEAAGALLVTRGRPEAQELCSKGSSRFNELTKCWRVSFSSIWPSTISRGSQLLVNGLYDAACLR